MDKMLKKKRYIILFVMPALFLFVFFGIMPLIATGIYSLYNYDGFSSMEYIGFQNYIDMFTVDDYFLLSVKNSFILVIASVFIQLPISLLLALVLSRGVKGEKIFINIYFIPVVISSMVIGQLWLKIFNSDYGLLNALIRLVGPEDFHFSWLTNPKTAYYTTVVPAIWQYIGYHMLILYAGIKSIPSDYNEAAKIDGASKFQISTKITIPLLSPVLKICIIFAVTGAMKTFDLVYVITGGGPNHISEVPGTLMYSSLFQKGIYGYGSAEAFFIVIECLLISFIISKIFRKAEDNASAI